MENIYFKKLVFYVNGKKIIEEYPDPTLTLLVYLRDNLLLKGSKEACGQGGCGACTVSVARYDRDQDRIIHYSANACLLPIISIHGQAVTTVEGLGTVKKLHPIQERLAASHGTQCGFCSPGFVMSMYTLLRNNPHPSQQQIEKALEGNLCRCTGYRPILEGLGTFSKENFACPMGKQCCKNRESAKENSNQNTSMYDPSKFKLMSDQQEVIFPSELQLDHSYGRHFLKIEKNGVTAYRPIELGQIWALRSEHPDAKCFVGNTEVGIETRFKERDYPVLINLNNIAELKNLKVADTGICIGGAVTLADTEQFIEEQLQIIPEFKTRSLRALLAMLKYFAGTQIRNVACMAGNIVTASPISDINPVLVTTNAVLTLANKDGTRNIIMDKDFFISYRKTKLNADDIIVSITIPFTSKNEYCYAYKQAQRKDDDIATVNSCIRVILHTESRPITIKNIYMAFGGMAEKTIVVQKAIQKLNNKEWTESTLLDGIQELITEMILPVGSPGGKILYRQTLCVSFFYKFFIQVNKQLNQETVSLYDDSYIKLKGVQIFEGRTDNTISPQRLADPGYNDCLGHPVCHLSAYKHTTGECVYVNDIPKRTDELYLAFVLSTRAHANIISVDKTEALKLEGVFGYVDNDDIPGEKIPSKDCNVVFAQKKVTSCGQIVGAIAATSKQIAEKAAKMIKIEYEELPYILTVEEAAKSGKKWKTLSINKGDVTEALENSKHVISGEIKTGAQEHFCMETQVSLVIPRDDDEYECYVSTQCQADCQSAISLMLNISCNKISVKTKRLGGGFGGKDPQSMIVLLPVTLAAYKFRRPVRCSLDRSQDMQMTGTRHPYLFRYKVGVDESGQIQGVNMDMYANCGNNGKDSTAFASELVLERTLVTMNNAYFWPTCAVRGHLCVTNLIAGTAFRGFGVPQGTAVMEDIIDNISLTVNKAPEEIRELNMNQGFQKHILGQTIDHTNLMTCYRQVKEDAGYEEMKGKVDEFNKNHRWVKRGLSVVPIQFYLGLTYDPINQGGALVNIYRDGSVQIYQGGVEMGQGLFTKMAQIASRVLDIPLSLIHVPEANTDTIPNATATCASYTTDFQGEAVKRACEKLRRNLYPVRLEHPEMSWKEVVERAYCNRINLSATGHFGDHESLSNTFIPGEGNPISYSVFGACCCLVEIDCLTGDHKILRTDIVMDIGQSLNPAIDIGQIEGAFMQGYGMYCLEEMRVSPIGHQLSRGPDMYKIPSVGNVPKEFNVRLLKNSHNPKAVYSSKGIGEPPLLLGITVQHAIKQAIYAAREHHQGDHINGSKGHFRLDSPATPERIRMACTDRLTEMVNKEVGEVKGIPYFVTP